MPNYSMGVFLILLTSYKVLCPSLVRELEQPLRYAWTVHTVCWSCCFNFLYTKVLGWNMASIFSFQYRDITGCLGSRVHYILLVGCDILWNVGCSSCGYKPTCARHNVTHYGISCCSSSVGHYSGYNHNYASNKSILCHSIWILSMVN